MSVAFLLVFAAAAGAQLPQPDQLATEAMHNFGACVVRHTPHGARQVLAMDFRSKEYERRLRAIARGHDRCAPGSRIAFNGVLFAGAMAEALLETEVRSRGLVQRLAFDPAREVITARGPADEMALCTVFKAPDATARLLATKPATPEEAQAMQPLTRVLAECLRKDTKVGLNKPALRSLLALAGWRIVSAPWKTSP